MRSAPIGASSTASGRTFGRKVSAIVAAAQTHAETMNTALRLKSAMKPPIAGPTNMPAIMVDCMKPKARPRWLGGVVCAIRPFAAGQ